MITALATLGLWMLYRWEDGKVQTGIIRVYPHQSISEESVLLYSKERNVWKIKLAIQGTIEGSGTINIGDSESHFVYHYDVRPGPVDINYEGDWYTQSCAVQFIKKTSTTGELLVTADFIGR